MAYKEEIPHTASIIHPDGMRYIFDMPLHLNIPPFLDLLPGLQVRGNGGFVMLPPSLINGQQVRWEDGCGPTEIKPAAAPAWLVGVILKCMEVSYA